MIATAYVLIKAEAGKGKKVYDELLKLKSVQHVDAVTGPFDLIVLIQAADFNEVGRIVFDKLQKIKGVEEIITCNVLSFEI
ncbi:MAG: Lrp/AsnC ligand binding domain-containing protein [bacterium]|nr:Lrp/AsnC ligand binding domain-containing protein [bacterium]